MLPYFPSVLIGVSFKILGHCTDQPLLGAKAVASMLMFATVSGILMALFLNTSGGAWDNAKKYIESGALGGNESDVHKTLVTAGPFLFSGVKVQDGSSKMLVTIVDTRIC